MVAHHTTTDDLGRTVAYAIVTYLDRAAEGARLVSIHDPNSAQPARRIVDGATQAISQDEVSAPGLTVYGRNAHDRPALGDAVILDRDAAEAIISDCIRKGLAYEDPSVCAAVRKRLGMSQSELGIRMGMAPDNDDPVKRRDNVGRVIRRYETTGCPVTFGLALRWLAMRAGLIDSAAGR